MIAKSWTHSVVLFSALVVGGGCSVLLPAHSRSNAREAEEITIRMLTADDITNDHDLTPLWVNTFPNEILPALSACPRVGRVAPFAAQAASFVIGAAIDYTKKQLREEAALYEAQFKGTLVADDFWCPSG